MTEYEMFTYSLCSHVILGVGDPSALQLKCTELPNETVTSVGSSLKRGSSEKERQNYYRAWILMLLFTERGNVFFIYFKIFLNIDQINPVFAYQF